MSSRILTDSEDLRAKVSDLETRLERAQSVIDRLRESEFRQNELLALMSDAVIVQQGETIVFANVAAAELHGYDAPEQLIGTAKAEIVYPENGETVGGRRRMLYAATSPDAVERRGRRRDGTGFICETRSSQIVWNGEPAILVVLRDITERRQAEKEAREQSALLGTMLEIMGHGYCLFDAEFRLAGFNRKYAESHQFPPGFLRLGMSYDEVLRAMGERSAFGDGDVDELVAARLKSAKDGEARTNEMSLPDGTTFLYQRRPMPNGGFVATFTDITDRKRAEQALRESEARYRGLIDDSILPIQISTADRSYLYANRAYLDLLGFATQKEFFAQRARVIAPHDRERIIEMADARKRGEDVPDVYEYDAVRKDGTIIPLQSFSRNIVWKGKQAFQRTLIDLTERKKAERSLHDSEARFRNLIDGSLLGIQIGTLEKGRVYANRACMELFGYDSLEELSDSPRFSLVAEHDRKRVTEYRDRLFAGDEFPPVFEFDGVRKDGSIVPIQAFMQRISWQGEDAIKRTFIDLTERKKAERALFESEEKLRKAFENTGIGMAIRSAADRSLICNDALCGMLGYSREELEAVHIREITYPGDWENNRKLRDRLMAGEIDSYQITKRLIRKNGEPIWVISDLSTIRDEHGRVISTITLYQDLTEMNQAEEQLRQAQKMEAVGQLTGGVAHDFNNLLTVVQGNLSMIAGMAVTPEIQGMATMALKAAKRGAELTHRLLAFSRRQQLAPEVIRLDGLVADMIDLMRRTLGETIQIEVAAEDGQWSCEVDPGQLENAILNLALNARDAMPDGGALTIRTENATVGEQDRRARKGVPPGDYAAVSVIDTGSGMSAETLEHVFEPFFTTKQAGSGSGLGLSMVHGFISQSDGYVTIDSIPEKGTTVTMYLPKSEVVTNPAPAHAAGEEPESRGELVLVVEDDPDVRAFTVMFLDSLGYRTVEAGSGKQAMDILRGTPGIDLVFTDVVLPGEMSGVDIAREAARQVPGIRILLTSGYPDEVLARNGKSDVGLPVIAKPFRIDDLARGLRAVLDGQPA